MFIKFITPKNRTTYQTLVLDWLEWDFNLPQEPKPSFWHNRSTIIEAFENYCAMVALTDQEELIGYMIWSHINNGCISEIDIAEVKKDYQKQGVFKKMMEAFCENHPQTLVLTAYVLQQSQKVFEKMSWNLVSPLYWVHPDSYFKIIAPTTLTPEDNLSDNLVIAICSQDYYEVKANPEKYQKTLQYFKIKINKYPQLTHPIITLFHDEGYIAIYYNRVLLTEGKAKHLFNNENCHRGLFVMNEFSLKNPNLLPPMLLSHKKRKLNPTDTPPLPKSNHFGIT